MTADELIELLKGPNAPAYSVVELLQQAQSVEWSVPADKTVLLYSGNVFEASAPAGQLLGGQLHTYQIAYGIQDAARIDPQDITSK